MACSPDVLFHRPEPALHMLELISLHVPKALGTSIAEVLAGHYGKRRVIGDYGVFLESASPEQRLARPLLPPTAAAIHGHFPAIRYDGVPAQRRVTFLREPIGRAISHFFFWQAEPRHGNALHDLMLDERLGLLDFVRLPAIRHFYSETIFGGCDMARFDLVGIVERLDRDWPRFQRLTGIDAPLPHVNVNRYPFYSQIAARLLADANVMHDLRCTLSDDIAFYQRYLHAS
jgi:hypothetical protein